MIRFSPLILFLIKKDIYLQYEKINNNISNSLIYQ